jgi:hypothetical protein
VRTVNQTLDLVLACSSCGLRYLVPGGVYAAGAVDLIRLALKDGWIGDGKGGHLDPTCAKMLGVQSGMAADRASVLTTERARVARAGQAARLMGRKPAKHDPRTLKLSRYLTPEILATPPPRVDWSADASSFGPMGNDVMGDCTIAAPGHLIQCWSAANGAQIILPDAAIVAAYSAVGGYVPGDASTDNGAFELDVLNYWRQTGVGGHKILAYVAVDPANRRHVEIAMNLFGGLYAGLSLPLSAQEEEVWTVPNSGPVGTGAPGSWGGHAVPWVNYGPLGVVCVTWGALKTMTWNFAAAYTEELYACLSDDWAPGGRVAPNGFDLAALQADLAAVAA